MRTILAVIAWVWAIVIGGIMILFPAGGGEPEVVCITCGGPITIAIAIVSILIGIVGILAACCKK
jgi:hypothetical protein